MTALPSRLIIIAGPNGAGKSSFTKVTQEALQVPIIDPDEEARRLNPDAPEAAAIQGGKEAIKRASAYLANNQSFAVETTLAGKRYLRLIAEARQKGWQVSLIYIGIDNVETSIQRVAQRVAAGGHSVLEADIRRRYTRSLANLAIAIQKVERTVIFDNSTAVGYQKVLTIEVGRVIERVIEIPEWVRALLPLTIVEQLCQNRS